LALRGEPVSPDILFFISLILAKYCRILRILP
jgi:hypothetical protein